MAHLPLASRTFVRSPRPLELVYLLCFAHAARSRLAAYSLRFPRSSFKKHTILLILAFAAFGGDFQSGAGIPLLSSQAAEWNMTLDGVNRAGNLNVLLLGLGGMIVSFLRLGWQGDGEGLEADRTGKGLEADNHTRVYSGFREFCLLRPM
jgi:hypothetical protein